MGESSTELIDFKSVVRILHRSRLKIALIGLAAVVIVSLRLFPSDSRPYVYAFKVEGVEGLPKVVERLNQVLLEGGIGIHWQQGIQDQVGRQAWPELQQYLRQHQLDESRDTQPVLAFKEYGYEVWLEVVLPWQVNEEVWQPLGAAIGRLMVEHNSREVSAYDENRALNDSEYLTLRQQVVGIKTRRQQLLDRYGHWTQQQLDKRATEQLQVSLRSLESQYSQFLSEVIGLHQTGAMDAEGLEQGRVAVMGYLIGRDGFQVTAHNRSQPLPLDPRVSWQKKRLSRPTIAINQVQWVVESGRFLLLVFLVVVALLLSLVIVNLNSNHYHQVLKSLEVS